MSWHLSVLSVAKTISLISLFSFCSNSHNLCRGANPEAVDKEGRTPFQLLAESAIDDVELFALMKNATR